MEESLDKLLSKITTSMFKEFGSKSGSLFEIRKLERKLVERIVRITLEYKRIELEEKGVGCPKKEVNQ